MIKPIIKYHENGKKRSEEYFLNDQLHRTDGPAYICWYENGQKWTEEYYLNGQYHNGCVFCASIIFFYCIRGMRSAISKNYASQPLQCGWIFVPPAFAY